MLDHPTDYAVGCGWQPGLGYYEAPYSQDEVTVLKFYEPERLQGEAAQASQDSTGQAASSGGGAAGSDLVGEQVRKAKGEVIGRVTNVLRAHGAEYVTVRLPRVRPTSRPTRPFSSSAASGKSSMGRWFGVRAGDKLMAG